MAALDDFITAFKKMNLATIKAILLKDNTNQFAVYEFDLNYLSAAFSVMEALGNAELKLSKKFYKMFTSEDIYTKKTVYHFRCKFLGNKTKQHITIFIDICEGVVTRWYDCTDIKNKIGEVPIDNL